MNPPRNNSFQSKMIILALMPAALLSTAGCEEFVNVTPAEANQMLNNPTRPDARREGIAVLATRFDLGKKPVYIAQFQRMAQYDKDPIVRSMAIRALNLARDSASTKIFIDGLKDDNELVRLESVKALANIPDTDAIAGLLEVLQGNREVLVDGRPSLVPEAKDVRIYAADALRHYRSLKVADALVGYLNEPDFGVAWQSRQSLVAMTGQDLNYNQSAWLQYLVGPGKPFG